MFQLPFTTVFLLVLTSVHAASITAVNNCPSTIQVFLNGVNSAILSPKAFTRFINVPETSAIVQLSLRPTPVGGTMSNIFFPYGYYYVTQDNSVFNAGVSITPDNQNATNGFCGAATCNSSGCSGAFTSQPQLSTPSGSTPPPLPLHACNYVMNFTVTWCPDGSMPPQPTVQCNEIHPIGSDVMCAAVQNFPPTYGTPVNIYTCNGSAGQGWVLQRGTTKIRLTGTNFCLDAGNITNTVPMKVWPCVSVPQQQWVYQDNSQFVVTDPNTGQQQCLDTTANQLVNGNPLQTYYCTPNSVNQIFTVTGCTSPNS